MGRPRTVDEYVEGFTGPAREMRVLPTDPAVHEAVAVLHERCFPKTHLSGRELVDGSRDHTVVVAMDGDRVLGYASGKAEPGEFYLDFVAVEPDVPIEPQLALSRKELPTERTHEYGSWIIEAVETNKPARINGNVPNRDLIPNFVEESLRHESPEGVVAVRFDARAVGVPVLATAADGPGASLPVRTRCRNERPTGRTAISRPHPSSRGCASSMPFSVR